MEKTLTYDEFIAFLLIYTSHVDYDFSDQEKSFIKEKVDEEIYKSMYEYYLEQSEYGSLKIIMDHKSSYFGNEDQKTQLLELIEQSFKTDGEYSKLEKNLLNFLNHLL